MFVLGVRQSGNDPDELKSCRVLSAKVELLLPNEIIQQGAIPTIQEPLEYLRGDKRYRAMILGKHTQLSRFRDHDDFCTFPQAGEIIEPETSIEQLANQ